MSIASSSLLDLASQAPSAMVKLFMKRNTRQNKRVAVARDGTEGRAMPQSEGLCQHQHKADRPLEKKHKNRNR